MRDQRPPNKIGSVGYPPKGTFTISGVVKFDWYIPKEFNKSERDFFQFDFIGGESATLWYHESKDKWDLEVSLIDETGTRQQLFKETLDNRVIDNYLDALDEGTKILVTIVFEDWSE